jgi:metal-responsive CopG/Arc/MetJ family transcriptional regulator
MKEKTSITLSSDVLTRIDRLAGSKHSRSAFIERVLRKYLQERARAVVEARDLERINAASERLNSEASDVLEYQTSEE